MGSEWDRSFSLWFARLLARNPNGPLSNYDLARLREDFPGTWERALARVAEVTGQQPKPRVLEVTSQLDLLPELLDKKRGRTGSMRDTLPRGIVGDAMYNTGRTFGALFTGMGAAYESGFGFVDRKQKRVVVVADRLASLGPKGEEIEPEESNNRRLEYATGLAATAAVLDGFRFLSTIGVIARGEESLLLSQRRGVERDAVRFFLGYPAMIKHWSTHPIQPRVLRPDALAERRPYPQASWLRVLYEMGSELSPSVVERALGAYWVDEVATELQDQGFPYKLITKIDHLPAFDEWHDPPSWIERVQRQEPPPRGPKR